MPVAFQPHVAELRIFVAAPSRWLKSRAIDGAVTIVIAAPPAAASTALVVTKSRQYKNPERIPRTADSLQPWAE
jgi:hypothetical protein